MHVRKGSYSNTGSTVGVKSYGTQAKSFSKQRASHPSSPPASLTKKAKLIDGGSRPRSSSRDYYIDARGRQALYEEIDFFDRVKRVLDKQVYQEFLKCLNLYTQEILNKQDLVHLVSGFLGKVPDLLEWFKRFIGYKDPMAELAAMREMQTAASAAVEELPEIDFRACKRYGPSYRALPQAYQDQKCSGRTELCEEVLNDTWVSFPSWSEDSVFLSSKKNVYEEQLFKCEDERYELDRVIEANLATIRVLEPLSKKLQALTPEEAQKVRLGPTLGGVSESIYAATIRRIYEDRSGEILEALRRNPHATIPIVLRRLKQKDEEWRQSQREWNKLWREVHEKNYYKAFDHQGINFKSNDKRTITSKALVEEIETCLREARAKTVGQQSSGPASDHFVFPVANTAVVADTVKVCLRFAIKSNMSSAEDKETVEKFAEEFLPWFLNVRVVMAPSAEDASLRLPEVPTPDEEASGSRPGDLGGPEAAFQSHVLLGSEPFYVLFRLIQFLYSRLLKIKEAAQAVADKPAVVQKTTQLARDLALQSAELTQLRMFSLLIAPSCLFLIVSIASPPRSGNFYSELFGLLDRFFENVDEMDQSSFEDQLRGMFGTSAYVLFTSDKLVSAIFKQVWNSLVATTMSSLLRVSFPQMRTIISEAPCLALLKLYHEFGPRMLAEGSAAEVAYHSQAIGLVDNENLYRIEYVRSCSLMQCSVLIMVSVRRIRR